MNNSSQEIIARDLVATASDEESSPMEKSEPGLIGDLFALTKARLSLLVLITTFVGFCMASEKALDWLLLVHTLLGTALIASSAAILNQVIETKVDRLMERTKHRPLPAGRMKVGAALTLGMLLAFAGFFYLAIKVNLLTASLAAATIIIYLFLYTPLKRRTSFCIIVGAISGAIPPVIGWTAAQPSLDLGAWILFGVLFLWQIPHFLAIAWMYRDEYAQAGFRMLRKNDLSGVSAALESLLFTLALVAVTLIPTIMKFNNTAYLVCALILDAALLGCAIQFLMHRTRLTARRLFLASILYLPCLLGVMIFTKT